MRLQAATRHPQLSPQQGEGKRRLVVSDARGVSAHSLRLFMDKRLEDPRWLQALRLAYHPGRNPRKRLPGPLFDASLLGLFAFLAVGYALA